MEVLNHVLFLSLLATVTPGLAVKNVQHFEDNDRHKDNSAKRRNDDMLGVMADEFIQEYEPVAVAAVPIRVLPYPPNQRNYQVAPAASVPQPNYLPYPQEYPEATVYRPRIAEPAVYTTRHFYDTQESNPSILYARPNKYGGYNYRRPPSKSRRAPPTRSRRPPPPTAAPVIIRIHKYRVIES